MLVCIISIMSHLKVTFTLQIMLVHAPSFIHSSHFYSTSSSLLLLRSAPDTAWILCPSFTPKRHRQLRVKDLHPYVAARAGFEPTTLRPKGFNSTNAPPRLQKYSVM